MSPNRRIALNVIATYGRSLYALACGFLTGRWALMALGETDYGLYGVIGGLTAFVMFFNSLMAYAVGRFYAVSVGEAKKAGNERQGLEDCRHWFNVALLIHSVLPCVLISTGYPVGLWMINNYLSIPLERVADCIWVWRFTCAACFIGMCSVPFQAMFTAKQEIAELTIYGVLATTLNTIFLYYMVSHPGAWLKWYGLCMGVVSILPNLLIVLRARWAFKECRLRFVYMFDLTRLKKLLSFAGARSICLLSEISSVQGMAILINKWLGAARNASLTIGHTVTGHAMNLAGAFNGALYPAIANAVGEGCTKRVHQLTLGACKLSLLSFLIFMLPLSLEIDYVMRLWLKEPPAHVSTLCLLFFGATTLDRATDGYWMVLLSNGKIAAYQLAESLTCFSSLVIAALFLLRGIDVEAAGLGLIGFRALCTGVRLYYGRKLCAISASRWFFKVLSPYFLISLMALVAGCLPRFMLHPSFYRLVITTLLMEVVLLPLAWFMVLDVDTRNTIITKVRRKLGR